MLKKIVGLFVLTLTITLVGCQPAYDYGDFMSQFVPADADQMHLSDDTYYIYLFSYTCSHCEAAKPDILPLIKKIPDDEIYLLPVETFYVSGSLQTNIDPKIVSGVGGLDEIGTPSLVEIKDHQVSNYYVGEKDILPILEGLVD